MDILPLPVRLGSMDDADKSREQASRCRRLSQTCDDSTAASLEMLAKAYDEEARQADIAAKKRGVAVAAPQVLNDLPRERRTRF